MTIDDDFRIFCAFRFIPETCDYVQLRELLGSVSWQVVDTFRRASLFCSVATFPQWSNLEDMRDFGQLMPIFPVNSLNCICVQVQPSPIQESFTSLLPLAALGEDDFRLIRRHLNPSLPFTYERDQSSADYGDLMARFRTAPLVSALRDVFGIAGFIQGIVLVTNNELPEVIWNADLESSLFRFWLNLASEAPMPVGFAFGEEP